MLLIQKTLKFCVDYILQKCENELYFLNSLNPGLLEKFNVFLKSEFKVIEYSAVIDILLQAKENFDNKDIKWGMDLQKEHERYIAENVFKKPVFIINYPK